MISRNTSGLTATAVAILLSAHVTAPAGELVFNSIAPGYATSSVELGIPFGGAIAKNPLSPNSLYVSTGNFSAHAILEVELDTGTTRTVSPPVGNVGGLAFLLNGDLAITDNYTSNTILRARDLNLDGDWLDAGEVTELIAPVLTTNFSGAQMAVAPAGNSAGIPTGSLLIQTADGGTNSEILVVENPETSPAFRPVGGAFYAGFTYNGGLDFTPEGHVLCGVSEFPFGRVTALVNSNSDADIDAGESHDILDSTTLVNSIADLSATANGTLITTENSGTIRQFDLPDNLLTGTATGEVLAETNGIYLSSVQIDYPDRSFAVGSAGPKATLYAGGYVGARGATNLLAITPATTSAAADWQMFE